jgi:hypothetical protein
MIPVNPFVRNLHTQLALMQAKCRYSASRIGRKSLSIIPGGTMVVVADTYTLLKQLPEIDADALIEKYLNRSWILLE